MHDMLDTLEAIIRDRRCNPAEGSYTARLLEDGRNKDRPKGGRRSG